MMSDMCTDNHMDSFSIFSDKHDYSNECDMNDDNESNPCGIDVDGCKEYVESKQYLANEILDMIVATIDDYNAMHRK